LLLSSFKFWSGDLVSFVIIARNIFIKYNNSNYNFGKTAVSNDLKLLGTRLISLEQILENL
jgi:hypothetical protein